MILHYNYQRRKHYCVRPDDGNLGLESAMVYQLLEGDEAGPEASKGINY